MLKIELQLPSQLGQYAYHATMVPERSGKPGISSGPSRVLHLPHDGTTAARSSMVTHIFGYYKDFADELAN